MLKNATQNVYFHEIYAHISFHEYGQPNTLHAYRTGYIAQYVAVVSYLNGYATDMAFF